MRVHLMAVGTRDPFWMKRKDGSLDFNAILDQYGSEYASQGLTLIPGPILSFFERQPIHKDEDWIVLISTAGELPVVDQPTVRGGKATKAELHRRYGLPDSRIVHQSLHDVDPSDFGAVAGPMRQLVQHILQEIEGQNPTTQIERIVNVSPGTPQMQAVWYVMANAGQLQARLLQMKQKTDQIVPVSISPLAAEQFIELGLRFLQDYSFNAASAAFQRAANALQTYEPNRVPHAKLAQEIAAAYHDWSIFQYNKAADRLRELLPDSDLTPELGKALEEQIAFLQELPQPIPKLRAINLIHAARLEYDRHDTVESIWRAGAAYEQILLERALRIAERRCGFRPNPFEFRNSLNEKLKETMDKQKQQRLQDFIAECKRMNILQDYLGISLVKPLLERDSEFRVDHFWEEAEKKLAWIRNNAVHRSEPVTEEQALKGLEIAQEALQRTFGNGVLDELNACPFSSQRLTAIRGHLAALLKG